VCVSDVQVKTAAVLRFSGYGDALHITPLLRVLKARGYRVVLHTHKYLLDIFDYNPNIDEVVTYGREIPDTLNLPKDSLIVDTGGTKGFMDRPEDGGPQGCDLHPAGYHLNCNACESAHQFRMLRYKDVNYSDFYMELAGFEERGQNPELYFSPEEVEAAEAEAETWEGKFVIFWAMSNTSFHKHYPWWGFVATEFCNRHPDALMFSLGDAGSAQLEVKGHPQIASRSGMWGMRWTMSLMPYASIVVGGEGGIVNAASVYQVPKVVFMSHSNPSNLTKYWDNTTILIPENVPCYPCHQLHDTLESCPLVRVEVDAPAFKRRWPMCMGAGIHPGRVLDTLEMWYRKDRGGLL